MKDFAELLSALTGMVTKLICTMKTVGGTVKETDVESKLKTVVTVAAAASSRGQYETSIGSYQLSDYKVAPEFKSFFLPCKIAIDSSYYAEDMSVKGNLAPSSVPSPGEFAEAEAYLLSLFKKTLGDSVSAADLTAPIDLVQAAPKSVYNNKVNEQIEGLPLFVKSGNKGELKLYADSYYNLDVTEFLTRWVTLVFIPNLRA